MGKLVCLWCVPRSISTAFEKMMDKRGDFFVYGEPFLHCYKKRRKINCNYTVAENLKSDELVATQILKNLETCNVFIKEMAYHLDAEHSKSIIEKASHAFLIRHPSLTIPSLFSMNPEFTLEETGFPDLLKLFNQLKSKKGAIPTVIDGESLKNHPSGIVANFTDKIGLKRNLNALNWHTGSRDEWTGRESWHKTAINSTGFFTGNTDYSHITPITKVSKTIREVEPMYNILKRYISY